jgi:DNA repair protein RecN (Recombination protein N)
MASAVFQISFNCRELHSGGVDDVEFLISANPGEPPRPLAKIASGGEMSRLMLAIKSVMMGVDKIPTLVFDEIDVGVGGRTAEVVGRKLESLSRVAQVLCITHLPQIASLSGEHFHIEKQQSDGRTVVRVRRLGEDERVEELARMLGGAHPTETAIRHAKEMLEMAESSRR